MFETLQVSVDGSIGEIVLNRPKKLNALSTQLLQELIDASRWFDTQEAVKVVVIKGNGRVFSAGADISSFGKATNPRAAGDLGRRMAEAIEEMQAIAIAQIHGWCVGGALVLAAACDLRVATADAQFSIPEVDLGIPLAWGGIPRLVREIGPALTKELVITCRPFGADEAKQAGFLNRVVSAENLAPTVQTLAQQIASKPALPTFATKRHTNAVTANMVGTTRAWSDTDSLIAATHDPECIAVRAKYMKKVIGNR
ncbi:MAG: enoyl-CoA hydratase/isomerase family protein [Candidatus Promineifilaceae bacterium]